MSNNAIQNIGGYRIDLENRDELVASASPVPDFSGAYKSSPPVEEPWKIVSTESQMSQGSCQGHALSTIVELCYGIASKDAPPFKQLSRQYAYIETQRIDGLIGGDRGSTISGGMKLATTKGICEETLWPYTGRYHTSPASGSLAQCYENAKNFRIAKYAMMRGYDDVFNWIDRGTGGAEVGLRWNSSCEQVVAQSYRGGSGGGHAIAWLFKSPRLDPQGRNYIWENNSWSERWGNRGWAERSADYINQAIADSYTVCIGLTDMVNVVPRPLSHIGKLV